MLNQKEHRLSVYHFKNISNIINFSHLKIIFTKNLLKI